MLGLNVEANDDIMEQVDEVKTNTVLILPKRFDRKVTMSYQHTACTDDSVSYIIPTPYYIHWKKTYTVHA